MGELLHIVQLRWAWTGCYPSLRLSVQSVITRLVYQFHIIRYMVERENQRNTEEVIHQ